MFQVVVVSLLAALAFTVIGSLTIVRPLRQLRDDAEALVDHHGRRLRAFRGTARRDEIGELARALEALTGASTRTCASPSASPPTCRTSCATRWRRSGRPPRRWRWPRRPRIGPLPRPHRHRHRPSRDADRRRARGDARRRRAGGGGAAADRSGRAGAGARRRGGRCHADGGGRRADRRRRLRPIGSARCSTTCSTTRAASRRRARRSRST